MAMMFGRFDIQSEISKSDTALIYKAMDTESNQVVALKTQTLELLGERAQGFVEALVAEGERTRELASQNIVPLYGAGEIDGQFCAAMEYIQGNSIATMLTRNEGFSIWDLLDITRQVCAALGHAGTLGVVHSSLEPAKIMVQWDGLVKILGYGISNMSLIQAEAGNGLGRLMPYCSPEQIRGEAIDQRSNLFTLGAILYEMVAGRKAFGATDPVALVGQIENEMPAEPLTLNPKIQPGVSALIMKALAKDPSARYQTARELVEDLEKCKEGGKKAAEPKKAAAKAAMKVDPAARAAAAAKFVSSAAAAGDRKPAAPTAARSVSAKPVAETDSTNSSHPPGRKEKAAAATAGVSASSMSVAAVGETSIHSSSSSENSGARMIEEMADSTAHQSSYAPEPVLSTATVEDESEACSESVAVDPMMAGGAAASTGRSFSDLDELPPLKEPVFTAPPPPEPEEAPRANVQQVYPRPQSKTEEKPKIQPREVAGKAIREISTIPPRLMLFSILGAVAVILVVVLVMFFHVRSEDDGSTAAPRPVKSETAAQPAPARTPAAAPATAPPIAEAEPPVTVRKIEHHNLRTPKAPAPAPTPVVVPGQVFIDSTPQGVAFQLDGKTDPSWVTPFTVSGVGPGKHIVSISKNGYGSEMRSLDVASGAKSSIVIHLAPINALVVVNSTPGGAEITLDGKVTGRVTPSQFAVEKGTHTVLLKKQGYLDETVTSDLGPGQNFQFAPTLRPLGNADEIRTVGKFKKLFGGSNESTAGMGGVSIHTQPKGAQVAINQRMLDKLSPVEIMVGPGNYVVDITMTGFKPVHKVITVEKGGKVAIDEILERD
ncbi:MAG TPA: serine/threonine-protein kinase [Terriglobales bacterium]|nr:serine/threonine-protein kinase [Terriglobales bacterium]